MTSRLRRCCSSSACRCFCSSALISRTFYVTGAPLHPFEGLRWAVSERGYPSAPIRAVLCRILGLGDTLRRERPLGWPPCHVQGSADRVDQEGDFQQQAKRFFIVDESGVVRPGPATAI